MINKNKLIKSHLMKDVRDKDKSKANVDYISHEVIAKVRDFHKSFNEYSITPLHKLENLAEHLGLKNIFLKDESYRFGLNAFKVLGGSYAIGKYLAEKLGMDISEVSFDYLRSEEVKEKLGEITFVTATDYVAARGMRILAAPLKGDPQIVSGESGAVSAGVISLFMEKDEYSELRKELGLDENSVVLLISTEGDTDPKKYKEIVWDGEMAYDDYIDPVQVQDPGKRVVDLTDLSYS